MNPTATADGLDRIPPHNLEAEAAVLGSILVDNSLFRVVSELVKAGDFYADVHAIVFGAFARIFKAGEPIDKISVAEELRRSKDYDKLGGIAFLSALMETVQSASSAEYYAKLIAEKSTLRSLISAGLKITEIGYTGETDVEGALGQSAKALRKVTDASNPAARRSVTVYDGFAEIDDLLAGDDVLLYPTPFGALNGAIGGWPVGAEVIVCGPPKAGKSLWLQTALSHISATQGDVAFFPLELGRRMQTLRFEQMLSGVSADKRMKRLPLSGKEISRIANARETLFEWPIHTFENVTGGWSTDEVISACYRLAADRKLYAVGVDTVGWLRDVRYPGAMSKNDALDQAQAKLLDMAKDLKLTVFLVWHFNRTGAKAGDEVSMHDLRDGGNPEGNAHHILAVTRPEFDRNNGSQRDGFVTILATRSGRHGKLPFYFDDDRGVWHLYDEQPWFEKHDPTKPKLVAPNTEVAYHISSEVNLDPIDDEPPFVFG